MPLTTFHTFRMKSRTVSKPLPTAFTPPFILSNEPLTEFHTPDAIPFNAFQTVSIPPFTFENALPTASTPLRIRLNTPSTVFFHTAETTDPTASQAVLIPLATGAITLSYIALNTRLNASNTGVITVCQTVVNADPTASQPVLIAPPTDLNTSPMTPIAFLTPSITARNTGATALMNPWKASTMRPQAFRPVSVCVKNATSPATTAAIAPTMSFNGLAFMTVFKSA